MLRKKIKKHLLKNGWKNDGDDRYWYHPTLGVRPFETAVIWQMTQEGAYADQVPGWNSIQVPAYQ